MEISNWDKFQIDRRVIKSLLNNKFEKPTQVQSIVLGSQHHYNDFIIASQTGSGKTLSFGIPIISDIIRVKEKEKEGAQNYLRGLILAPTRELAMQIEKHMNIANENSRKIVKIVSIVGGMSSQKQTRLIDNRPDILIATPGRLMDIINSRDDDYLDHLDQLDFFVLDEADRMIEMGHFREVDEILGKIWKQHETVKDSSLITNFMKNTELQDNDEMFYIKDQTGKKVKLQDSMEVKLMNDDNNSNIVKVRTLLQDKEQVKTKIIKKEKTKMKIFLASATLMHTFRGGSKLKLKKLKTKDKMKRRDDKKKAKESNEPQEKQLEDTNLKIKTLFQKLKFSGKPKIVDLTTENLFPENLQEYKTVCTEDTKALYLYQFIKSHEGEQFIIFANSISYAKKISNVLLTLQIDCVLIHSEMQQKQRLKKLDKFKEKKVSCMVATDVAARGLDVPKIQNVVHYQVPDNIDTYIHRSGRTARINQEGRAYVLIGPKDMSRYSILCKELKKDQGIESVELNIQNQQKVVEMIESALRLESSQHVLEKSKKERKWFQVQAKRADLDIDSDIQEELKAEEKSLQFRKAIFFKHKNLHKEVIQKQQEIRHNKGKNIFLTPSQIQSYAAKIMMHTS